MRFFYAIILAILICAITLLGCGDKTSKKKERGEATDSCSDETNLEPIFIQSAPTYTERAVTIVDRDTTIINLSDSKPTVNGEYVQNKIELNSGTYIINGSLTGQIIIDSDEETRIILNGVTLRNVSESPIVSKGKGRVIISLNEGTENIFISETSSAISVKGDLIINGEGNLELNASEGGINCAGTLKIASGRIAIYSDRNAITAQNEMKIFGGELRLDSKKVNFENSFHYMAS